MKYVQFLINRLNDTKYFIFAQLNQALVCQNILLINVAQKCSAVLSFSWQSGFINLETELERFCFIWLHAPAFTYFSPLRICYEPESSLRDKK